MQVKFKFLESVSKVEDINYDDYYKVVFISSVLINEKTIKFKFTEEEGDGVYLEVWEDDMWKGYDREDGFEYLFITELFLQTPIDFSSINEGQEFELDFTLEDDGENGYF